MTTPQVTALLLALIACSMAVPVLAQPAGAPVTVAPATVVGAAHGQDPNQVICKRQGEPGHLGSHQICGTRADWARVARDSADALTKIQNASHFSANPMDGGMSSSMGSMSAMGGH